MWIVLVFIIGLKKKDRICHEGTVIRSILKTPTYPLMLNATAQEETNLITIKQLVINQLVKPVFWRQCMESLKSIPIDTFLEIGPGRVLSGLVRINGFPGDTVIYNVNNMAGVHRVVGELVAGENCVN